MAPYRCKCFHEKRPQFAMKVDKLGVRSQLVYYSVAEGIF